MSDKANKSNKRILHKGNVMENKPPRIELSTAAARYIVDIDEEAIVKGVHDLVKMREELLKRLSEVKDKPYNGS